MRKLPIHSRHLLLGAISLAAATLAACSAEPIKDPAADKARADLIALQSDPQLANKAPVAMKDAQDAVDAAEVPQKEPAESAHLAYLAQHKVDIARAQAQARYEQDQMKSLSDQRAQVVLDARTREADARAREVAMLQQKLADLAAKQTDRGIVFTLGDVLFATGKADLKPGAAANLDKLADFLNQHPDRQVAIEGHTDSTGSDELNLALSQKRADAVKVYLMAHNVDGSRLTAIGKGKDLPVADNTTAEGRQANRRVEVVVANPPPAPAPTPDSMPMPGMGTMPPPPAN